jgi:hypothetical protein|tara:strand:+ start:1562 stop:2170 length:609 start_codon:yes stop_codon:yes gene_type:complete
MEYQCTEERFLESIKNHKMDIIKNDNLNRHIRFKQPDTNNCYFDLITWLGHLCIAGDMGTFVFSRLDDMFKFFRNDPKSETLEINLGYWDEKIVSESRFGGVKEFSNKKFKDAIKDYFNMVFDDSDDDEKKKNVWQDIEDQILSHSFENGYEAHGVASEFESNGFIFQDFWEYNLEEYTYHFTWCLYAIVYGIKQFDENQKD